MIGLRDNGNPVIQYGGDGMIIETGWNQPKNTTDFEIEFKGQHLPADAMFKPGDTTYQDSTITGTLSRNATNENLVNAHLTIDSKVPVEIQFQGISDAAAPATNQTDAVFAFEAGQHHLTFYGKIISVFENK